MAKKIARLPVTEDDPLSDLDNVTVEAMKLWSVASLKSFLAVRGKQVHGDHDTLVARYVGIYS